MCTDIRSVSLLIEKGVDGSGVTSKTHTGVTRGRAKARDHSRPSGESGKEWCVCVCE